MLFLDFPHEICGFLRKIKSSLRSLPFNVLDMENIATKKFKYDHTSSYKSRGRSGISNRVVRAQRANEKRHVSRMDEISKRRRMPLSSLVDDNVVDVKDKETNGKHWI